MRKYPLFVTVVYLAAFSCAAPAPSRSLTANAEIDAFVGGAVVLSADAPTTVTVGSEFSIVLEENASTGYQWSYTASAAGLAEEIAKKTFDTVPEYTAGAPAVTVWKFRADAEGEAVFTYLNYRPWEKPETAVKRMTYTVRIVDRVRS
jgi:predicted secreted protein